MFSRSSANPMDELVTKATDENFTTENWELNLNVCDKVDSDTENGAKNAIVAIQKRLGHRNANVQLFSLTLVEALSKNCGTKVHREIASRAFTQSLLRLVNDRTTHAKVKNRIAELVGQWANDFKKDPSLGIMTETFNTLQAQGISVNPPSRPQKHSISDADRKREEEEIQMALAMSLKDTTISQRQPQTQSHQQPRKDVDDGPNAYTVAAISNVNDPYTLPTTTSSATLPPAQQVQQVPVAERTAATVSRVRALYDFTASEAGELTFYRGDVITVIESAYKDWWRGSLHGNVGIFPTNYVENLAEPSPADLQREAEEEQKVFAEAKNVEKLLSILSNAELNDPSLAENDQLQNLYHSTISIRPKLVRLIEKYSQKKDDLIVLNEKFTKARRDYDDLMEASLSRYSTSHSYSPHPTYQAQSPGAFQQPIHTGNYPAAAMQRQQYSGDMRQPYPIDQRQQQQRQNFGDAPQQHFKNARESRIVSDSTGDLRQYRGANDSPGVFNQGIARQQGQRTEESDPHAFARYNAQAQQVPSDPYEATNPQYPPQQSAQPAIVHNEYSRQQAPYRTPNDEASSPYPHETQAPVSQELSLAFPPPEQLSSYDHERAEREGGPPIAYYKAEVESPVGNAAPDDYEDGDAVDPHDYYRGRH